MIKSINPRGFVIPVLKVAEINLRGFLLFQQLLFNKVDFRPPNFEAAVQLQIEVKQKMLGRLVTFGVKSVEKRPQTKNFFDDP